MSSRTLNRKDFLIVTVTAVTASVIAACGGDDPVTPGGTAGTGGSGTAGTGGSGTAGTATTAGTASGGTSTAGTASGGTGAGSGGSSAGTGGASGGSGGASGGTGGAAGGSGGASAGAGGGGGGSCGSNIVAVSSGGHKHTLTITVAQLTAGTEVTVATTDSTVPGHEHYVKITAADFTMLKAGMEVKKKSCKNTDHEYVLKCGGGGAAPGTPTCADECGDDASMASACQ